ncbi:MAG: polyhydroxyalkanoate depolymerase [Pseudomonadota bacterium]
MTTTTDTAPGTTRDTTRGDEQGVHRTPANRGGSEPCTARPGDAAAIRAAALAPPRAQPALHAGALQPRHRPFLIDSVAIGTTREPVIERAGPGRPFFRRLGFERAGGAPLGDILLVPPLSGHFPVLMRDLVLALLAEFRVHVVDWANARHVPLAAGRFGLDDNVGAIMAAHGELPPDTPLLGLCQSGVSTLAAASLLAARAAGPASAPRATILIGAPIDPDAAPTRIVSMLRATPAPLLALAAVHGVTPPFEGRGRTVYPAERQLAGLMAYAARHIAEGRELRAKLFDDDGAEPGRFPFSDLFTAIMDLDRRIFLEGIETLYRRPALRAGRMSVAGRRVDPGAIRTGALLTIEGAEDDIAAPGQTAAAHALCTGLPAARRHRLLVERAGHFSLFHGRRCREVVAPSIAALVAAGLHADSAARMAADPAMPDAGYRMLPAG